ncbi:hypothetical protein JCM3774_002498 [Rhodotorula dairenensis]
MAEFSYDDLISEGMLGFNPSPAFQIPVLPTASPHRFQSPAYSGTSTPARGSRGGAGRGGGGGRGGRGGNSYSNSPSPYPDSGRDSPTYGGGRGRGGRGGLSGLGAFNARGGGGRGRGSGNASPRGGFHAAAGSNPLLVPVKFVPATGPGLGTVGGQDEHGLEIAGAEAPPTSPPAARTVATQAADDAQLVAQVGKIDLVDNEEARPEEPRPDYSVPETAFEPEPATTATMALDELEDAPGGPVDEPTSHPGIGMAHARKQTVLPRAIPDPRPSSSPVATGSRAAADEEEPPLFEISVTRSEVIVDVEFAPPAVLATHRGDDGTGADETDESEDEQIVYPARAVTRADPVFQQSSTELATTVAAAGEPAFTTDRIALPQAASRPPRASARTAHVSQPQQPALKSKKALKRESRAARKAGRAHTRSGNGHLGGGRTLADSEDDESGSGDDEDDLAEGAALFTQMQGGVLDMSDMLDAADVDVDVDTAHEDGQPRMNDSDIEWGSDSPPPVGARRGAGATRGRAKKELQRQQRADQRQAEKLERLVAAGSTREQVEVAMALEASRHEAAASAAASEGRAQRAHAAEERLRLEKDYLTHLDNLDDDAEGDDSMAVMAAFANGAVGSLGGIHVRGDDLDRRLAEDEEEDDSDAWGTSDDEDTSSGSSDSDEDTADAADRRLAREEEDESEDAGSSEELEMEYSLGDADGRVEHSLSLHSSDSEEQDDDSDDSSLSSSTDSAAEDLAVQSALLAGRTIKLSSMGQSGGGGRKAERERKKERRRARKGKMRQADSDSDDDDDDDEASSGDDAEMFGGGEDTWADDDEDFIAKMQGIVRDNADLLETAKGGKGARRSNRRERNKLFKAISNGNFEDVDLYNDAVDDLDDEMIDALLAEEEERAVGLGSSKKKRKNAGKNYGGAFSASLAEQWELDRKSKAQKKAERAASRAAAREAESRDAYRGGGGRASASGKKKAKAAREAAAQSNDAATINKQIRQFIQYEIGVMTMSLPPMSKKSRIAVHLLAEAYGLKSRSLGKGTARFPVLERTSRTSIVGVSERKITAIVGTADGEDEISMGYGYGGGRPRGGGKMSGLWKALEGASGKRTGGGGSGGRGAGIGRNSEGAVVGQGADKLGTENIGFALLKKMGWTEGGQIGLSGGIHEPVAARVKTNRQGLGSGYSVTQRQAYGMARRPSSPDSDD